MTTEDNKALVRRFIREIFQEGRVEALDELVAPDFVRHTGPSADTDRDELRAVPAGFPPGRRGHDVSRRFLRRRSAAPCADADGSGSRPAMADCARLAPS